MDTMELRNYCWGAVQIIPLRWKNDNGLRAVFRRFKPENDVNPRATIEMASAVSGIISPKTSHAYFAMLACEHAALLLSLRAEFDQVSNDTGMPLGKSCFSAGVSDRRFLRLVTTPKELRFIALKRMAKVLSKSGVAINWNDELASMYDYLFGDDEHSERAVRRWSGDFFLARAIDQSDGTVDEDSTDEENNDEE